jgi:DNA-binding NtrC family response regulator
MLIIDDESGFALIVQRAAEEIGLQVRVLTDATQLEDVLAAGAPDVITLDMEMPSRHGLDVLKALSARKLDQRVVIISGAPPPLVADRQLAAGFTVSAVLTKPARKQDIQAAILRALELGSC